ncbi:hypothetical protein PI124_g8406 [Phytophthora idaei]|nr:hypothetical protein PI125_g8274 [Phytophthora idaei]KAG3159096.1 hypothetical protein PI126_g7561 [Phytophthora idaei]KAG3246877.1 hypothetical protein PI124_g8406 [Phytophthora idaei]
MSLPDFIRLLRGESGTDPSPNKALRVPQAHPAWGSYKHASQWEDIVRQGVIPEWRPGLPRQAEPPPNNASSRRALPALITNLRKGQDTNRYLVLDIDLLPQLEGVFCSPFGAVQKGDKPITEDARIIHDLSFPKGESINDFTAPKVAVDICYDGAKDIATRIENVEGEFPGRTRMMSGDVSGAFRDIPVHAEHADRFEGTIPELGVLIFDLCCPFGRPNSPAEYWIAGGAINSLYSSARPVWSRQPVHGAGPFDGKVWCDDRNCGEPDIGSRLGEAAISLRRAKIRVLGPAACDEEKFTEWFSHGSALGLDWNLEQRTVSMLEAKLEKARQRVEAVLLGQSTSKTQLNGLLGSLRHVVTCIRPAGAFFQRIS